MLTEKTFETGTVSIHYAEGPVSGRPLVMLHGGTLRWQDFLPVLPLLSFRYHTYALDLCGHGRSGRMPGAYRIDQFADDVEQFLRVLVAEPLRKVTAMSVAPTKPSLAKGWQAVCP
jgi:pimeloyl-ACP methyl ester carboxylesterase